MFGSIFITGIGLLLLSLLFAFLVLVSFIPTSVFFKEVAAVAPISSTGQGISTESVLSPHTAKNTQETAKGLIKAKNTPETLKKPILGPPTGEGGENLPPTKNIIEEGNEEEIIDGHSVDLDNFDVPTGLSTEKEIEQKIEIETSNTDMKTESPAVEKQEESRVNKIEFLRKQSKGLMNDDEP